MASRLVPALLAALLLLLPSAVLAEERILRFVSDVAVRADGTLDVTETIRVRAEGDSIRRGIFRDFPTSYQRSGGQRMRVGFDVQSVERNGSPEPWSVSPISNGVRLRIGDPDVLLTPGEHAYRIRYATTRQIGFFDEHDELYWNATGTGWAFPIDVAEARIRLPQPVRFGARSVYTGSQGAREANAAVVEEEPGRIAFRTTAPLGPRQGLTVAAAWPKGVVAPPPAEQEVGWWLSDNGPLAVGGLGLLGTFAFYFAAWRRVGRGPSPGTRVPLFSPPDDLSPAASRYVLNMGSDNRVFAAALIDLGVRGKLRLVEGEAGLLSRPKTTIEKRGDASGLPEPEAAMLEKLFAEGDSILMDNKNHARFSAAQKALSDGLKRRYEGKMFLRNLGWSLRGLAVALLAILLTAAALVLASPNRPDNALPAVLLGLATFTMTLLLGFWVSPQGKASRIMVGCAAGLLGLATIALGMFTIVLAIESGRPFPLVLPLMALPVVISAFWWMAAPTRAGRALMDRIEGFKQYLAITEEERLARMHPPAKTPELFERYLPYAVALKVENAWADKFAGVLATASAAGHAHTMAWYSGHSDPWNDPGGFVDTVGSSLSSSVASASTAPGSSSGSGGGGSSGGGGGGGGGGGW